MKEFSATFCLSVFLFFLTSHSAAQESAAVTAASATTSAVPSSATQAASQESSVSEDDIGALYNSSLTADQQSRLTEAQQDLADGSSKAAYDILSALVAELQATRITYIVKKGDSLWTIAGRADVYGNPFLWPLIFRDNANAIKNADDLYPKQALTIAKYPLRTDARAAAAYSMHRGKVRHSLVNKNDRLWVAAMQHDGSASQ